MSEQQFLAHIAMDGRKEPVKDHLIKTARLASQFADGFHASEQGYLAGLLHDIGKYSMAFQQRLLGCSRQVDHSTAGAFECMKNRQVCAAFAIAGHHSGIPNGGSRTDSTDEPSLLGRVHRARKGLLEPYENWLEDIQFPDTAAPGISSDADIMFFTRMLYSCLVDADFLCTESFMSGESRQTNFPALSDLNDRLTAYTQKWYPPQNKLNALRCKVLDQCRNKGIMQNPGLFTLTVPTGGGKTVASMTFALSHAKKNKMSRIIYVIPYTSIIEQSAKVFRDILGDDAILEHHSGVLYDLEQEADPNTIRMAQATENWDMPVIVTTAVQFFESLFSNRSSKCRKLHNLANSVIIFDEAQLLPLPYLKPCVYGIAQLVRNYGASAVLCTATQPVLEPFFREFLPDYHCMELCPTEIFQDPVFQRTSFKTIGLLDWDQLSEQINKIDQVLCIVNSRKSAQEIYRRLQGEGCYHLSTLMYPEHREHTLTDIRQRLKDKLPCRVVSTSLIEAGVDVDFPAVYREENGLDSILQAAGRCNREGKNPASESIVTIFQLDVVQPCLFSTSIGAWRSISRHYEDIASQEAISAYFRELLELKGSEELDRKGILNQIKDPSLPFRRIAADFKLIESDAMTVYIPIGGGIEWINRLRSGERSKTLFRKLGRYSVSVYEKQFRLLMNAGVLESIDENSAILLDATYYDEALGLSVYDVQESAPLMQ